MKRVHYALGATAALAPAVIGATPHATAHTTESSSTKMVSLEHSAAKPAGTPDQAPSPCTASIHTVFHINSLIKSFGIWWKDGPIGLVCIGTVSVERHFKNNNCVNISFETIYGDRGSHGLVIPLSDRCGNAGSTKRFYSAFRSSFSTISRVTPHSRVEVCVSSTYTENVCESIKGAF